jgi:hypothetical protein
MKKIFIILFTIVFINLFFIDNKLIYSATQEPTISTSRLSDWIERRIRDVLFENNYLNNLVTNIIQQNTINLITETIEQNLIPIRNNIEQYLNPICYKGVVYINENNEYIVETKINTLPFKATVVPSHPNSGCTDCSNFYFIACNLSEDFKPEDYMGFFLHNYPDYGLIESELLEDVILPNNTRFSTIVNSLDLSRREDIQISDISAVIDFNGPSNIALTFHLFKIK